MTFRQVLLTFMAFETVSFITVRLMFPEKIEHLTSCVMGAMP